MLIAVALLTGMIVLYLHFLKLKIDFIILCLGSVEADVML